jgi:cell division protein FtsZ
MIKKKKIKKIKKVSNKKTSPPSGIPSFPEIPVHPVRNSRNRKNDKSGLRGQISNGVHRIKIKVIGIGGGGSSIVSEIASRISSLGRDKISFVAADTNPQVLKKTSSKVLRFCFGQNITHGLGTGMDTELGKLVAKSEREKLKKIFQRADLFILVASLGGGTGSGAAPVLAKISRNFGNLTFGIFTLPFKFEGEKKMEIARESLEKLKPSLSAISILPNERIFQVIDKKTPLKTALSVINRNLAESLESLLELAYLPGLINIDFADLRTIIDFDPSFKKGKLTYLNTIELEGKDKVNLAIKKIVSSPLYPYSIEGAKGILFNITGGKNISLNEVSQISKSICDIVKGEAKIIFGVSQDRSYKDKIKITLLATDCRSKIFPSITKIDKLKNQISTLRRKAVKKISHKRIKIRGKNKRKIKKRFKSSRRVRKKIVLPVVQVKREEGFPPVKDRSVSQAEDLKIRRNALQIKETVKKEEENKLAKERFWEIPAFLRKKNRNP